ncbi:MAG TPA: metallophosphoesterase [Anaerolineae bacterium]
MKILAVSDQVVDSLYTANVKDRFGDVDLILGCGDLPYFYLEFLVSALDRPLYYVNGNHDKSIELTADGMRRITAAGCDPIGGRVVMAKGLIIAGLDGSIRYNYESPYQFTQSQMNLRALRLAVHLIPTRMRYGRWLDILVAHSPPFGVGDGPDPAHIGFRALNALIRYLKPRYLLHGHQHVYRGRKPGVRVASTMVLNVFPYRVIEWGHDDAG